MATQIPFNSASRPTLAQRLQALSRRKTVIVLTFLGVAALATPFVLGLPSLYRASATVIVEGQMPDGFAQAAASGEIDNRLQSIKQEALSRGRLTDLVERFKLYPSLGGHMPMEFALAQLQRDIKIDVTTSDPASGRPTTVAFKITYTGRDPDTAAAVANRLASFFVAQNDTMRSRQATRSTEVLQEELTEAKKRVDAQEAKMQAFLTQHVGRLPQQMDANLLALGRLNTQLQFNAEQQSKLMERRQEVQKEIADLDLTAASATAASTADPVLKLAQAKRELADLQSRFNERYPDVRDKSAEVTRLEREVANVNGRTAAGSALQAQHATLASSMKEIESKLTDLAKEQDSLRSQTAAYEGRVESAPARGPEYDSLKGDYQNTRDSYDQILKKYDDARVMESLERDRNGEEFRILDAALPPPYAAGPNRLRLLVLGFLFAAACGIGAALFVDRADTSFHSIDDLRAFTQVPVLASIPRIQTKQERGTRGWRIGMLAAATAVGLVLLGSGAFHYAHGSDQIARLLLQVG